MQFKAILSLGLCTLSGLVWGQAMAATPSAELKKVFVDVCSECHVDLFLDPTTSELNWMSVRENAKEIIKRLDPKAPESIMMPPDYASQQISNETKLRIIKELKNLP